MTRDVEQQCKGLMTEVFIPLWFYHMRFTAQRNSFKEVNKVYSLTHFPMLASLWEVYQLSMVTIMLCSKCVKTIWLKTIYLIIIVLSLQVDWMVLLTWTRFVWSWPASLMCMQSARIWARRLVCPGWPWIGWLAPFYKSRGLSQPCSQENRWKISNGV